MVLVAIIVFMFLFWLLTVKFPKVGKGITDVGDGCYHFMVDKKHTTKEGNEASLLDLIVIGFKKFGKWFRGLFHKKNPNKINK